MFVDLDYCYTANFGLKFAVVNLCRRGRFKIAFENDDISYASFNAIKTGKVLPKFMQGTTKKDCIGKYFEVGIRQLYFDYKENCYILVTIDGELFKVARDGTLIDRIQE